jgi:transposase
MSRNYTDEFRRDAVRIATTSGLTRPQVSSDLGVGLSTLNKWVQKHPLPVRVLRSNIPIGRMTT